MQPHIMSVFVVIYLMFGTFCGVLFNHIVDPVENGIAFALWLAFWPLILVALLLVCVFYIPVKLAGWIYDKFEDIFDRLIN